MVQDIIVGNVLQPGAGENQARMAMFLAGFPETTCVVAINRFCSSGIESCAMIASKIKSGNLNDKNIENNSFFGLDFVFH